MDTEMDTSCDDWLYPEEVDFCETNYCDVKNGIFCGEVTEEEKQYVIKLKEQLANKTSDNFSFKSDDNQCIAEDINTTDSIEPLNISHMISPIISSIGSTPSPKSLTANSSMSLVSHSVSSSETISPSKNSLNITKTPSSRTTSKPLTPYLSQNRYPMSSGNRLSQRSVSFKLDDLEEEPNEEVDAEDERDVDPHSTSGFMAEKSMHSMSQPLFTIFEANNSSLDSVSDNSIESMDEMNSTFTLADKTTGSDVTNNTNILPENSETVINNTIEAEVATDSVNKSTHSLSRSCFIEETEPSTPKGNVGQNDISLSSIQPMIVTQSHSKTEPSAQEKPKLESISILDQTVDTVEVKAKDPLSPYLSSGNRLSQKSVNFKSDDSEEELSEEVVAEDEKDVDPHSTSGFMAEKSMHSMSQPLFTIFEANNSSLDSVSDHSIEPMDEINSISTLANKTTGSDVTNNTNILSENSETVVNNTMEAEVATDSIKKSTHSLSRSCFIEETKPSTPKGNVGQNDISLSFIQPMIVTQSHSITTEPLAHEEPEVELISILDETTDIVEVNAKDLLTPNFSNKKQRVQTRLQTSANRADTQMNRSLALLNETPAPRQQKSVRNSTNLSSTLRSTPYQTNRRLTRQSTANGNSSMSMTPATSQILDQTIDTVDMKAKNLLPPDLSQNRYPKSSSNRLSQMSVASKSDELTEELNEEVVAEDEKDVDSNSGFMAEKSMHSIQSQPLSPTVEANNSSLNLVSDFSVKSMDEMNSTLTLANKTTDSVITNNILSENSEIVINNTIETEVATDSANKSTHSLSRSCVIEETEPSPSKGNVGQRDITLSFIQPMIETQSQSITTEPSAQEEPKLESISILNETTDTVEVNAKDLLTPIFSNKKQRVQTRLQTSANRADTQMNRSLALLNETPATRQKRSVRNSTNLSSTVKSTPYQTNRRLTRQSTANGNSIMSMSPAISQVLDQTIDTVEVNAKDMLSQDLSQNRYPMSSGNRSQLSVSSKSDELKGEPNEEVVAEDENDVDSHSNSGFMAEKSMHSIQSQPLSPTVEANNSSLDLVSDYSIESMDEMNSTLTLDNKTTDSVITNNILPENSQTFINNTIEAEVAADSVNKSTHSLSRSCLIEETEPSTPKGNVGQSDITLSLIQPTVETNNSFLDSMSDYSIKSMDEMNSISILANKTTGSDVTNDTNILPENSETVVNNTIEAEVATDSVNKSTHSLSRNYFIEETEPSTPKGNVGQNDITLSFIQPMIASQSHSKTTEPSVQEKPKLESISLLDQTVDTVEVEAEELLFPYLSSGNRLPQKSVNFKSDDNQCIADDINTTDSIEPLNISHKISPIVSSIGSTSSPKSLSANSSMSLMNISENVSHSVSSNETISPSKNSLNTTKTSTSRTTFKSLIPYLPQNRYPMSSGNRLFQKSVNFKSDDLKEKLSEEVVAEDEKDVEPHSTSSFMAEKSMHSMSQPLLTIFEANNSSLDSVSDHSIESMDEMNSISTLANKTTGSDVTNDTNIQSENPETVVNNTTEVATDSVNKSAHSLSRSCLIEETEPSTSKGDVGQSDITFSFIQPMIETQSHSKTTEPSTPKANVGQSDITLSFIPRMIATQSHSKTTERSAQEKPKFEAISLLDQTIDTVEVNAKDLLSPFYSNKKQRVQTRLQMSANRADPQTTRSLVLLNTTPTASQQKSVRNSTNLSSTLRSTPYQTNRRLTRQSTAKGNSSMSMSMNESTIDFILNEIKCNTEDSDEFLTTD